MRASAITKIALVCGLAATSACDGGGRSLRPTFAGGGSVPEAGAAGGSGGSGGTPDGGGLPGWDAEVSGVGLGFGGSDVTKIVPTAGCGMDPTQAVGVFVKHTMQTTGTKPADCTALQCGDWSYLREYYVRLPAGYDKTKAYPLLFEGPGCGGRGNNVYDLTDLAGTVIRVGLSPSNEASKLHAIRRNQGCFDFANGDASVDWVFYENLYDVLAQQLCFDRNRVFVGGSLSGGGQLANELGCKYAGDATRPIRGMLANLGGLPTDPKQAPTCTTRPMAGMWIHELDDTVAPFEGNKVAIARAMKVNGCTLGTGYDDATFDAFPIGGNNQDTTCRMIRGCPAVAPLVVCLLSGTGHTSHDDVVRPGWPRFMGMFSAPPLFSP
jgi:poly(3-hydroxybutyrate) depolymerase